MSLYTNDTDTLRQMISQAIPQALMSFFTIIVTFISMIILSPLLTILAVVIIFVMLAVYQTHRRQQRQFFVRQQMSLADVTGFVEERMNGQRVVKVFNHERKSEQEFDKLNEALFQSAASANKFANMMGPVIGISETCSSCSQRSWAVSFPWREWEELLSASWRPICSLRRALPSLSCRWPSSSTPLSWLLPERNVSSSSSTRNLR